jgi:hypothetical protein
MLPKTHVGEVQVRRWPPVGRLELAGTGMELLYKWRKQVRFGLRTGRFLCGSRPVRLFAGYQR